MRRRHNISDLAAQIIASARPKIIPRIAVRAVAKPAKPNGHAQATTRQRRLRLAEADAALAPAPKSKRGPIPAAEACTSITVGGSSFDRAPAVRATDGGAPATSGAAKRLSVLATDRQVSVRLRRVDAASRKAAS
jgi:hypothetical protein